MPVLLLGMRVDIGVVDCYGVVVGSVTGIYGVSVVVICVVDVDACCVVVVIVVVVFVVAAVVVIVDHVGGVPIIVYCGVTGVMIDGIIADVCYLYCRSCDCRCGWLRR